MIALRNRIARTVVLLWVGSSPPTDRGPGNVRFQSETVVQPVSVNYNRWVTPGTAADEFDATLLTFKSLS